MYSLQHTKDSFAITGGNESVWALVFYKDGEFILHFLNKGAEEFDYPVHARRENLQAIFRSRGLPLPEEGLVDGLTRSEEAN